MTSLFPHEAFIFDAMKMTQKCRVLGRLNILVSVTLFFSLARSDITAPPSTL